MANRLFSHVPVVKPDKVMASPSENTFPDTVSVTTFPTVSAMFEMDALRFNVGVTSVLLAAIKVALDGIVKSPAASTVAVLPPNMPPLLYWMVPFSPPGVPVDGGIPLAGGALALPEVPPVEEAAALLPGLPGVLKFP